MTKVLLSGEAPCQGVDSEVKEELCESESESEREREIVCLCVCV